MEGYKSNIEQETINNTNFRRVLYTAKNLQLVLMALQPGEDIGFEVHENDQFFRFESGAGKVMIDENSYPVEDGDAVIVPAGSRHNVINTSEEEILQMYTLYAPPHHKAGIVRATKKEAEENDEEFDGKTTE